MEGVLRRRAGEGRAGCLAATLLLISAVYIFSRAVPVYLAKIEFEENLARIASRAGAENWRDRRIVEQVLEAARVQNFEVSGEDVRVRRTALFEVTPRLIIEVSYRRSVEFPGYVHVFEFQSRVSSIIGRL